MKRDVLNVTVFAVAMANVEAMIVVYLRRLYYPDGFALPLVVIDMSTLRLELVREACTVMMLAAFGLAAGRTSAGKFAHFLIGFGLWDIFYYIWLKLILNWPPSLLTWDVLFLIPIPWIGPVLAPMTVACTMIGMGLTLLWLDMKGAILPARQGIWFLQIAAACVIILSFTIDVIPRLDADGSRLAQWVPTMYRWWMLMLGQVVSISAFACWARHAWRHAAHAP